MPRPLGHSKQITSPASGVAPAVVTSISPQGGPSTGGTNVTIRGTGFTGQTSAKVGGVNIDAFTVVNDTTITGTTHTGMPAAAWNSVQVGTSTLTNAFYTGVLTLWQQASFPVPPVTPPTEWPGSTSGGPSGARELRDFAAGVRGAQGAALNGLKSVLYDNSANTNNSALGADTFPSSGGIDISDVVDPGPEHGGPFDYCVRGLSRINAAAAATAQPYQSQSFINGNARWGILFDDTNIGPWHFTGAFPKVLAAHPGIGTIFAWQVRWKVSTLKADVSIGAVVGAATALAAVTTLAGVPCLTAIDGFNSALGNHECWNMQAMKSYPSDADFVSYRAYLARIYGIVT